MRDKNRYFPATTALVSHLSWPNEKSVHAPPSRDDPSRGSGPHQDGDGREKADAGRTSRYRRLPRKNDPEHARGPLRPRSDLVRRLHGSRPRLSWAERRLARRVSRRRKRPVGNKEPIGGRRARLHGGLFK